MPRATRQINDYLAKKLEGGLFAHPTAYAIGDEIHLGLRYHTVLNGVVYELNGTNKDKTGDELITVEAQLIRVGDYVDGNTYSFLSRSLTHDELLAVIKS